MASAQPREVDLNADVGESFGRWRLGDDEGLLDVVTSANVACGFHAGDPPTLRRTCELAAARGVAIGAQVGYRDLAGFGRRFIDVTPEDLTADVLYQLGALDVFARSAGTRVRYVKPHGALYNAVVHHEAQALAVVRAVREFADAHGLASMPVLGLPGSSLLAAASEAGLPATGEFFADRGYTAEGRLVSRQDPSALVTEPDAVARRAARMATAGEVVAVDGTVVPVAAQSICVHGDSPDAAALARAVRSALNAAGVTVRSFTPPTEVPRQGPGAGPRSGR
ncbi:MAG: LamB/YcsF family protein [Kineosporiaceae bacterium]|nr:LamB/YcsF family protein [Kineosporiaceae bacterium]